MRAADCIAGAPCSIVAGSAGRSVWALRSWAWRFQRPLHQQRIVAAGCWGVAVLAAPAWLAPAVRDLLADARTAAAPTLVACAGAHGVADNGCSRVLLGVVRLVEITLLLSVGGGGHALAMVSAVPLAADVLQVAAAGEFAAAARVGQRAPAAVGDERWLGPERSVPAAFWAKACERVFKAAGFDPAFCGCCCCRGLCCACCRKFWRWCGSARFWAASLYNCCRLHGLGFES